MKELENFFEFYDLDGILDLKESIDYAISMIDEHSDVRLLAPLLGFNSSLSTEISKIVAWLDDENSLLSAQNTFLEENKAAKA